MGTINSTQIVTVQWDSTIRPSHREYCYGSRRYSVYVFMFGQERLDDYVDNGPVMSVPSIWYINTNEPRETHYTLPPPVRRDLYYIFQIQNRRRPVYIYTGGSYLYKQFTSPIFYFGEQSKLSLYSNLCPPLALTACIYIHRISLFPGE